MKGYKDAPDNWAEIIKNFFGIDKLCSMYGMSELMPLSPLCPEGCFHVPPYLIPVILNDEFKALPEESTQVGRFSAFDLLAETYWGGFVSSDKVTMHWDGNCKCGWGGPRIEKNIVRFSELEGGDDKITCAGSSKAYSEFMNYVQNI